MKALLLLSLACSFFSVSSAGEKTDEPLFSVDLPEGWTVHNKSVDQGIQKVELGHEKGGVVMIMTWKATPHFTTSQAMESVKKSILRSLGPVALEEQLRNWHGQQVKDGILLIGHVKGQPFVYRLYAVESTTGMAIISEGADMQVLASYQTDLSEMSSTFTLK